MRIRVRSGERNINLILPTALVFSPATAWAGDYFGRKYSDGAMDHLPPDALKKLFAEIRRIKRKHGKWNLVEIDTADGEHIKIEL